MPRYSDRETRGRATKSVNLSEGLIVELRKRQAQHHSFSDAVNHYIELGLQAEDNGSILL